MGDSIDVGNGNNEQAKKAYEALLAVKEFLDYHLKSYRVSRSLFPLN